MILYGELQYAGLYISLTGENHTAFRVLVTRNNFVQSSESFNDFKKAGQAFHRAIQRTLDDATLLAVQAAGIAC